MGKFREELQDIHESAITSGSDANANYNQAIKEIEASIKTLQKQLKDHQKKQKKEPKNWGFAGDLDPVKTALQDAVDTLK